MSRADFAALDVAQAEADGKLFANPRNAAAAPLRQKDASVTARRLLALAHGWGAAAKVPATMSMMQRIAAWACRFPACSTAA